MDAYKFWERVDGKNPHQTLKRLTDECGIDYRRVKKNRSDQRLPNLEDAYLLASHEGTSVEYLLTGKEPEPLPTMAEKVLEYLAENMPGTLEDVRGRLEKKDGSSLTAAG